MHDLLHELSQSVSSQECANISSSGFSADKISPSTRHLAITIGDKYNENFGQEMAKLKSRIHIRHLRTLMIFGGYDKRIVYILKDTLSEIEDIRVLFIVMKTTDSLPKNFSKLLHLRYLQIRSSPYCVVDLPSTLSRFYHLIFLDLQDWTGNSNLPKYFTHLMNLRHFIANHELHSNVPEVGKIEHLEELKAFHVKKESVGFELEELGKLKELGGELSIRNLQRVATKGEANKANLALKRNLKKLGLVWGQQYSNWVTNSDDDVADGFQPHDNLRELTIGGHGGAGPPSWLCRDIPMRYLELLTLKDVSWCTLPPFGELPYLKRLELCNIDRMLLIEPDYGTSRKQSFMHLKKVVFRDMPLLERWIVEPNCRLFPALETIECCDCPNLLSLSFFPECSVSCTQGIHCPSLRKVRIDGCPKLFVSPIPPAPALTSIELDDTHRTVTLRGNFLEMNGYSGALAFHNLVTPLTGLSLFNCDILTVDVLNLLSTTVSVKELAVSNDQNHPSSIALDLFSEVARRTKQLPAGSFQLEKLHVDSISSVLVAALCSHLSATLHTLTISSDQRVESLTAEEEEALQLLTSLETLDFQCCPGLPSLPQGLHSISSLYKLKVQDCPEIQSLPKMGLPSSLGRMEIKECSAELHEEVMKLRWTNLRLITVDAEPKASRHN